MEPLHPIERKVLFALKEPGELTPDKIALNSGLDINSVMRSINWLSSKGLIRLDETFEEYLSLGSEGKEFEKIGLPERRAAELLKRGGKSIIELQEVLGKGETAIALGWLRKKGMASIERGKVRITEKGGKKTPDEQILELLKEGTLNRSELKKDLQKWIKPLLSRKKVIAIKEKVVRRVSLLEPGRRLIEKDVQIEDGAGQLTHEIIKSGKWRKSGFRDYNISTDISPQLSAKLHPLTRMIEDIKEIFVSMGFKEIEGPLVESNFWNFDALFVPQDHPAREMQDTFYLKEPKKSKLPKEPVVKSISEVHKNGAATGSVGWRYDWAKEIASNTLLRTHTTSATIRHLAKNETLPIKVFSIGRVFRKERVSYKHLPEFHQIEGIVVGDVNFNNLLGILREFYARMGFERIRFRPAYFPYTEPSLEVEVFFEKKNNWIELGGAGIFRPEVSLPLGIEHPVLAWGLGLERLAMLSLDLTDIRAFYRSNVDWLRSLPL
jgi:phenylalanyl-tRNA synthetase alpha chain